MSKKISASNITKFGKVSKSKKVKAGDCEFPFLYKGKMVKECIDGENGKWCATEVNKGKQIVKIGFCPDKDLSGSLSLSNSPPKTKSPKSKTKSPKTKSPKTKSPKTKSPKSNKTKKNEKKKKVIKKKPKNNEDETFNMDGNNIPLTVPKGMETYLRPAEDILKIRTWENPNRKIFASWFNTNFKKYRTRKAVADVECEGTECEVKPTTFDLFTHQKIVRDYLNTESPYRGLIVYHGLGVGKTCSSIAIAEGFKTERQIVVLLQKSIKQNYISQLKQCGDKYFRHDNHWVFKKCDTIEERRFANSLGLPRKTYTKLGGWFFIDFKKRNNYDSLSSKNKMDLEEQIDNMIANKYQFVHANGVTAKQLEDMETKKFFDNKVVIIDEVHNLINGMASGGSMRALGLEKLFMDASNLKLIFLSGTPMKNIPFEIGKTFNILRGYIHIHQFDVSSKRGAKLDLKTVEESLKTIPQVDQVIIKSKDKIVKVTQNPQGFINSKDGRGLIKGDNSLDANGFRDLLNEKLTTISIEMKNHKVLKNTLFPNNNKDFMRMFYDSNKNDILDKQLFKRRIMGMVSYYSSARKELVPEIKSREIIEIPMSDYQFDKYSVIRKEEIDRDKDKKKKPDGDKGKKKPEGGKKKEDDIFSVSSSYRAYSRMMCQFVFPEDVPRPYKGDAEDLELDDDVSQLLAEVDIKYEKLIMDAKKQSDKEELRKDLKIEQRRLKASSKGYEKRLQSALQTLDKKRDELLKIEDKKETGLKKYSPKYADIIEKIKKVKGNKFIYTEYKTSEGVGILSIALKANGYSPLKVKKDSEGDWILDMTEEDKKRPKFALWSGDETSDIILRIFNNLWDTLSDKLQRQLRELSKDNMRGDVLEILMTTKQGAEGLNTKNVRQLYVVEPYWNPVRLDQVVGRAVRIGSHLELPMKDRNVEIYIYLAKATKKQLKNNVTMMNDFGGLTSDQVLFDIAERKRAIMNVMLGMMQESSIDCSLNLADNIVTNPDLKCLNLGEALSRDSYSSAPAIEDELKEKEQESRVQRVAKTFKTLQFKRGGKVMKVSRLGDKIYDYDLVENGLPGQPIGFIVRNADGKETIKLN